MQVNNMFKLVSSHTKKIEVDVIQYVIYTMLILTQFKMYVHQRDSIDNKRHISGYTVCQASYMSETWQMA